MKKGSVSIITKEETFTHWPCNERDTLNRLDEFSKIPISGEFPVFAFSLSAPDKVRITTPCLSVDRLAHGYTIEITAPRYIFGLIPFFPMIYRTTTKSYMPKDVVQKLIRLIFSSPRGSLQKWLSEQRFLERTQ